MSKKVWFLGIFLVSLILVFAIALKSSSPQPRTFSIIRLDSRITQRIGLGDILSGRGIPNSIVRIYLSTPKIISETKTNDKGDWIYKLPTSIKKGLQRLTIMTLDQTNQLAAVKSYKVEFISLKLIDRLKFWNFSSLRTARAQENPKPQFPEGEWVGHMISLGIFPVIENNEIIFYGKDQYETKYNIDCKNNPCYTVPESIESIMRDFNSSPSLLTELQAKLVKNGYDSVFPLLPYFPEIDILQKQKELLPPDPLGYKRDIDEETLTQFIKEVVQNYRESKYLWSSPNAIAENLIETTDPIFGFNSLIKWATLKPNQLSYDEKINALFAFTILGAPLEKLGFKVLDVSASSIPRAQLKIEQMIKESGVIRQALKSGEEIPFAAVAERADGWLSRSANLVNPNEFEGVRYLIRDTSNPELGNIIQKVLSGNYKENGFDILEQLRTRKGSFVELGGPTERGYELVDINKLDRKLHVTNIDPRGCPIYDPYNPAIKNPIRFLPIDFQADATNLKFADNSISALFASCLNNDIRTRAIAEIARVLEEGGLLIWQVGGKDDILDAVFREGLVVKESHRSVGWYPDGSPSISYNVIFQKPISIPPESFAIVHRSSQWGDIAILGNVDKKLYNSFTYVNGKISLPRELSSNPNTQAKNILKVALATKRISVIDPENIIKPIVEAHIQHLKNFNTKTGRNIPINEQALRDLAQNGYAYIVGDELLPGIYGMYDNSANFFVMSESIYRHPYGLHVIEHELFHGFSSFANKKGWEYMGNSQKDRIMTGIYEIMTDIWADISGGGANAVIETRKYPEAAKFIDRLLNFNSKLYDDFLEFAITADADQLLGRIFGSQDVSNFMDRLVGAKRWKPDYDAFARYLKSAGGINLQAITYSSAALELRNKLGQGDMYPVEPTVEFGKDFITDDYNQGYFVIINGVQGQITAGGPLNVSVLLSSKEGISLNTDDFLFTWLLDSKDEKEIEMVSQVKALSGGEKCSTNCQIILPSDLQSGIHTLTVYLTKKGSDQILGQDSFIVNSGNSESPTVSSLTINSKEPIQADQFNKGVLLNLPGVQGREENFNIPIVINYSNGASRYTALTFKYQPTVNQCPKPYPQCGNTTGLEGLPSTHVYLIKPVCNDQGQIERYDREDKGESKDCGDSITAACPSPYPQCAKTVGLEDYPEGHTIMVTPVCDSLGKIISYEKQDLGNKGECQ